MTPAQQMPHDVLKRYGDRKLTSSPEGRCNGEERESGKGVGIEGTYYARTLDLTSLRGPSD